MAKKTKKETTTIKISVELRDRLKEMGKKGDTYEDIIKKLLNKYSEKSQ